MATRSLIRADVEALAQELAGRELSREEVLAAGGERAVALAVAAALAGKPLDASLLPWLMAGADDSVFGAAAVGAVAGDRLTGVLDAIESGRMSIEREAAALFLAVDLAAGAPPPSRLLVLLRLGLRTELSLDGACLIGAAALGVEDAAVRSLAGRQIAEAKTLEGKDVVAFVRAIVKQPLDAFPVEPQARVASGFTMRRVVPKIGRNDPCHCGSGKKYKKCHAAEDEQRAAEPSPVAGLTYAEYLASAHDHLSPEELAKLRPSELAALDASRLSVDQLRHVVPELAIWREWPSAERMCDVLEPLSEQHGVEARVLVCQYAIEAGALEVARRQADKLGAARLPLDLELALALAERKPDFVQQLESHLATLLREDKWPPLVELCFVLLRLSPALGILLSRTVALEAHPLDAEGLLEDLELARDRLLLPPGDLAGALYDSLAAAESQAGTAKEAEGEGDDASELKEHLADATSRIEKLQKQLTSQQAALQESLARPAERVVVSDEEERRRLRDKVNELKSLLTESHEERTGLRKELAAAARKHDEARPAPAAPGPREADAADDGDEVAAADVRKLGLMVPIFSPAAEVAIKDMPPKVARAALASAAALAAGEPAEWRGVKLLQRVHGIYSCRVGIHHRLLFELDRDKGRLTVIAFVTREDFDTTIRRLAKS